jgi:membrane-bound lytic murein transglycosylase B
MRRTVPGRTVLATAGAVVVLAVGGGSMGSLGSAPVASASDVVAAPGGTSSWSSSVPSDPAGVFGVDGDSPTDDVLPTPTPVAVPPPTGPAPGSPSSTPGSSSGPVHVTGGYSIPARVLQAYAHATHVLRVEDGGCHLRWQLLAAIGRIESDHAWLGDVDAHGDTRHLIAGPALDGGPGVAAIHDTDHGRWDGDTVWDRAVGPMQFIPTTWAVLGRDGNSDGVANPSNVDDSTVAAGWYLCGYGRDLSRPGDLRQAVHGYNHSDAYVAAVLAWMQAYTVGTVVAVPATPTATSPAGSTTPAPTPTTSSPTSAAPTLHVPGPVIGHRSPDPLGTGTPSGSGSPSPTPSGCPTGSPSPTPTDTSTGPATETPTPTPTPTVTPTDGSSPSGSADPTPSGCPTVTPTPSDGAAATALPTASTLEAPTP